MYNIITLYMRESELNGPRWGFFLCMQGAFWKDGHNRKSLAWTEASTQSTWDYTCQDTQCIVCTQPLSCLIGNQIVNASLHVGSREYRQLSLQYLSDQESVDWLIYMIPYRKTDTI